MTLEGEHGIKTKKQPNENNNVQRIKNNIPRNGGIISNNSNKIYNGNSMMWFSIVP